MARGPDQEFHDRSERHNRLWAIRDPLLLAELAEHLADARPLVADGHHRYAAYLRLQEQRPGTSADAGLAMLVDQDDSPLFLGAIHRTLAHTRLADVEAAAEGLADFTPATEAAATAALGPTTLVVTDGRTWARLELHLSGHRAAVEVLHDDLLPRIRGKTRQVGYHHSVEDALDRVAERRRVAVLMPAPDFDLVDRIVSGNRLAAGEGDLLPAEAERRRPHALAARRMIRAREVSTSTRDTVVAPAR